MESFLFPFSDLLKIVFQYILAKSYSKKNLHKSRICPIWCQSNPLCTPIWYGCSAAAVLPVTGRLRSVDELHVSACTNHLHEYREASILWLSKLSWFKDFIPIDLFFSMGFISGMSDVAQSGSDWPTLGPNMIYKFPIVRDDRDDAAT